jgi:hypothetical protein
VSSAALMVNRRSQLEIGPGEVIRRLTPQESQELCRQWELAYPGDREGIHIEQFMWHVFSFERYPSISRAAALVEYEKQVAPKYLVLANDRREGLMTNLRPTSASVADYLVCPLNWAWTLAFTHEDEDLGPYFAVHRNYRRLQAANVKGMRKVRETAIAKQQGSAKGDRSS